MLAYDRGSDAWQGLQIGGSEVKLQANGSDVAIVGPAGVTINGALAASNIGSAAARAESEFLQAANNLSDVASALAAAGNLRSGYVLGQSGEAVSHSGDTTEVTLAAVTVPANAIGPNGRIEIKARFTTSSTAANKTFNIKLGATTFASRTKNSFGGMAVAAEIANRNNAASQVGGGNWMTSSGDILAQAGQTGTEATTGALNLLITAQLANAADTITLESYQVILYPKA